MTIEQIRKEFDIELKRRSVVYNPFRIPTVSAKDMAGIVKKVAIVYKEAGYDLYNRFTLKDADC